MLPNDIPRCPASERKGILLQTCNIHISVTIQVMRLKFSIFPYLYSMNVYAKFYGFLKTWGSRSLLFVCSMWNFSTWIMRKCMYENTQQMNHKNVWNWSVRFLSYIDKYTYAISPKKMEPSESADGWDCEISIHSFKMLFQRKFTVICEFKYSKGWKLWLVLVVISPHLQNSLICFITVMFEYVLWLLTMANRLHVFQCNSARELARCIFFEVGCSESAIKYPVMGSFVVSKFFPGFVACFLLVLYRSDRSN